MSLVRFGAVLMIGAVGACAGNNPTVTTSSGARLNIDDKAQRFTRQVDAVPSRIVSAATQVFSERGIPVATSNEENGTVQSVELQLQSDWGGTPTSQRINCGTDASGQPIVDKSTTQVKLALEARQTSGGSFMTLFASGKNPQSQREGNTSRLPACILTASFATELLDAIEQRAAER